MQDTSYIRTALLQNLFSQSPYLLALLIGLAVSVVFMGRHRLAAQLVAAGIVLQLLSIAAGVLVQAWFMSPPNGATNMRVNAAMASVIYLLLSLLRAAGLGTLVAAAFVGRGGEPAGDSFQKPLK